MVFPWFDDICWVFPATTKAFSLLGTLTGATGATGASGATDASGATETATCSASDTVMTWRTWQRSGTDGEG